MTTSTSFTPSMADQRAGNDVTWQRPNCDARGCERLADLAFIGEGGDLYLCDFHGGAGEVEGWRRITDA